MAISALSNRGGRVGLSESVDRDLPAIRPPPTMAVRAKKSRRDRESSLLMEALMPAGPHAAFANVLLTAFDLGLEFFGKLQFILNEIFQPIQQRFTLRLGQELHLFFDLFQRWHFLN